MTPTVEAFDVAVAGGGPGGCAAAIALRAHAPSLTVAVFEAGRYEGPRVGETLPPPAEAVLEHLGVADAFRAQAHHPAYATAAAWGSAVPREHDFLFAIRDVGWHLDRARFDALLASHASARGAVVRTGKRVTAAAREGGGWRLWLDDESEVQARFVIDATGAGAAFARRFADARTVASDRLTGFVRFFRQPASPDPRTLVEAFADGWWYTAPLPDGGRVTACMTDSDLARRLRVDEPAAWNALLAATAPRVSAAMAGAVPHGPPVVRAARSRRLVPAAGEGWIAVGDAASAFDPLSSQGILKALRSGIYAAYAAGDLLAKGDDAGMRRYPQFVAGEFAGYLRARERYYAEERRWPEHEFWRRRQEVPQPA